MAAASQILRDALKFLDEISELPRQRIGGLFHAVVDVILDQLFLGIADRFFDGVQLLREVHARSAGLEHLDHRRQVALRPLQA